MNKCINCMWQITERFGQFEQVVDCMACGDEKCPTDADFEAAKRGGYLACYGCSEITDSNEE